MCADQTTAFMAEALVRADHREAVMRTKPDCPECAAVQVQLLQIEPTVWRCRNCGYLWNHSKNCDGCDLTKSEGDARE